MSEKKKLVMARGGLAWQLPDGTTRPLTRAEIKRLKTQIGQAQGAQTRKKTNEQQKS